MSADELRTVLAETVEELDTAEWLAEELGVDEDRVLDAFAGLETGQLATLLIWLADDSDLADWLVDRLGIDQDEDRLGPLERFQVALIELDCLFETDRNGDDIERDPDLFAAASYAVALLIADHGDSDSEHLAELQSAADAAHSRLPDPWCAALRDRMLAACDEFAARHTT